MPQIIELTDRSGLDYLHDLTARARNMRQPLGKIGQDMALSAKQRFVTATDPDGVPWAPNSATTLTRYGSTFARKKNGSLTKRGEAKLTAKKPGTGETRMLATTINRAPLKTHVFRTGGASNRDRFLNRLFFRQIRCVLGGFHPFFPHSSRIRRFQACLAL